MNISELRIGSDKVDLEADVTEVTEVREFNKFGRELKVATATLQDDSGTIKMALWNQDAEKVKQGDRIKVTNGYVKEFQGEKQLTTGKFGKLEIVGSASGTSKPAASESAEGMPESKE